MKFSLLALALVGAAVALPNGMDKRQESEVPTLTRSRGPRPTGGFPTGLPTGTFSIPSGIPTGKGKGRPTGTFSIPSGFPTGKGKGRPTGTFSIPSGIPTGKGKGKGTSAPPAPEPTSD